ncbi:MAG: endonuclease [Methanobacteriaceae archaeon]|nr:endonuclease [Methanobacteriaceae archaeon]
MANTRFISLEDPTSEETHKIIKEGLRKRAMIIIFSCCKVRYYGRAKSRLGPGERLIIIKPDGSFLIHQDRKVEPVNWQPPGSKAKVKIEDGKILVESIRRKPAEKLTVEMEKVHTLSYYLVKDAHELEVAGHEEDMRQLILESPDIIEKGFRPIIREYQTSNGFIDILGKDEKGSLMVLELKSRRAGVSAVRQLKRYLEDFKDDKHGVRGVLVAPSITHDARELLEAEGLEFKGLEPPRELKKGYKMTLDKFISSR